LGHDEKQLSSAIVPGIEPNGDGSGLGHVRSGGRPFNTNGDQYRDCPFNSGAGEFEEGLWEEKNGAQVKGMTNRGEIT